MMKQLARVKFSSNALKVPKDWQQPSGNPGGKQYGDAFKADEKAVPPDTVAPPLFLPASTNKYHVDTQKKLNEQFGGFIDDICTAICSAWSTWQSAATMAGITISAGIGSGGVMVGPPLMPLILAQGPVTSASLAKYTKTVATVIGTAWLQVTLGVKIPGLPLWPMFIMWPGPVAPPTPNPVPAPWMACCPGGTSIMMGSSLGSQMFGQHGDPTAPYANELFGAIGDAVEKCYTIWAASTMLTNILGAGAFAGFAPPVLPAGPVIGVGTMTPGGVT